MKSKQIPKIPKITISGRSGRTRWTALWTAPDNRDHPDGRASAYEDVVGLSLVYLDLLIYTNVDK